MQSKGSSVRFTGLVIRSRISTLMLSMFATFASLYVAGRLWQDAENRVYLAKELDRITGLGKTVMSVDDSWKIIECREQHKKLSGLEMELAAARQEGFVSKHLSEINRTPKSRPRVVVGVFTGFGRKSNRDAIRKAWMGTEKWDAEYYAKVNDDVYVNVDALTNVLTAHLDKPRVYIGCMKSGEVFSERGQKWYEPDWWKFGDGKTYFRHASGEMFVISHALAKFISINRSILRVYAYDDVSAGSWFIGLDVKHVDERKFCCSAWSSGLSLSVPSTLLRSLALLDLTSQYLT
ncbi:UNVERIFIED_CONTAM: Hydroxyproline O-galactosyltransferase HPGT1 [Sesamum radiatum]|uniref:Hexosyltransferase n=1 Tax=Sesamum radiatum TaxID=300843 RepID=A0AAW2K024_SESRA